MKIYENTIVNFIEDEKNSPNEIDFLNFLSDNLFKNEIFYAFSINENAFYKYSNKLKFWKKTKNEEVEKEIWEAYTKTIQKLYAAKSRFYETSKTKTSFLFNMTLEKMKKSIKSLGMVVQAMPDTLTAKYIPLQNGYIDFKTLEFKPLDKNIYNRYILPFEYTENTATPSLFLRFLEQIQPNKEHREFLLNWLAYMLIPSNPRQKSLFMLGAGQNGKGVLTRIMMELLGKTNTSSLTIPQLSAETYHVATIVNSLVNFSPDNDPNDKLHVGTFKAITGGDTITVRNIRGEPFEMNFLGKLIFSVNKMPYFSSKDSAVLRRVEILQFPVIIDDKNKIENLERKILANGGNELFMFLLNRARSLSKNGFKFDTPLDITEYSRMSIEENDSVFDFIEERLSSMGVKETYRYNELYKDYKEHCVECSFKPLNKVSFKESLLMHSIKRSDINIEFLRHKHGNDFIFTRPTIPTEYLDKDGNLTDKDGKLLF